MYKLCITGDLGFEVWKDIPGYEGLYQASTYGRVKSMEKYRTVNRFGGLQLLPEKILIPSPNKKGYLHLSLCNSDGKSTRRVHKLICSTFLPHFNKEHTQINHKNEDKTDNRVENLEWCTATYNNNYGSRNERASRASSKSIARYDLNGNYIDCYSSAKEIEEVFGFCKEGIRACCRGEYQQMCNYIWQYI